MSQTKIEWCDSVWNPTTGCTPISPGCDNCFAKRFAYRLRGRCGYPEDDPFRVTLHPERLEEPLRWRKPRRVFVCSMGDLFHDDVPEDFINKVFSVMLATKEHTYILLTKRPQRAYKYLTNPKTPHLIVESLDVDLMDRIAERYEEHQPFGEFPLNNAWLGVTAENQQAADERIPILLQIPAAVRFVSVEPMLGPVDLERQLGGAEESRRCLNGWHGIDWIICGGETGPNARPMHPDWVRSLREQAVDAGVPFFFKSLGQVGEEPCLEREE